MPEDVLYIRGIRQLRDRAVSPEMVDDLKAVASVPGDVLDEVANALRKVEGFLEPTTLGSHLRKIVPDDVPVDSLRRVILNVKAEDVTDFLGRLRKFQKADSDFPLSSDDLDQLAHLLPRLLKPIPALRRFRKAQQLVKVTGQRLEDIQLICDIRPVFDESRTSVEGLMPLTHLKVVATGGDGLPNVFEAELSAEQLSDLAKQADKAIKKLEILRVKADEWADFGMPNVPSVRRTENGATDA